MAITPTRVVYSYYAPRVREAVTNVAQAYPHDLLLQSIEPGLDNFHHNLFPLLERYCEGEVGGLQGYPHHYVGNGASELIFHELAHIAGFAPDTPIYTFLGEYEGYQAYATNLNLPTQTVAWDQDVNTLKPGVFFLSQPSSHNGNWLPPELLQNLFHSPHELVLDLTYLGATGTRTQFIDVTSPNIRAVLFSLSKPFGLYYSRIGFAYRRTPLQTIEPNKWFKNIFSLCIAREIFERFSINEIARQYQPLQKKATKHFAKTLKLPLVPSDVFLLAHVPRDHALTPDQEKTALPFRRADGTTRVCLTSYFLATEQGKL